MAARRIAASTGQPRETLVVRLLPGYQPRTEIERSVYAVLTNGPLELPILIQRVVEQLILAEIARGGWAIDVGVWGPSVYSSQVAKVIEKLDGSLLVAAPRNPRALDE